MGVTVDELRDYLSGTPPRIVPPGIRRAALRRIPRTIIVMGVFFTLFSVPFMVMFFPWRLLDDIALNTGGRVTQDGVVDACKATGMKENDRRVFSFEFSYIPGSGDRRTGSCYATGVSREAGTRVAVEYLALRPGVARIQGCRLSPFHWAAGFVIVFPGIGVGRMFFALRARRRVARLLVDGVFSAGRIDSVEATPVRVNNQTRYRVNVVFKDAAGERRSSYSAYGAEAVLAEQKRAAGAVVGVLYDPADPSRVLLMDELVR